MLLAHKIELYPTKEQREYLDRSCGSRRHCFNQLLAHFKQDGVKWSKKAALGVYNNLRQEYPWYSEVSQRVTRNTIDDLDSAFKHFFRRVKLGQKPGFPRFKKKGMGDSFAFREKPKFSVDGRWLRIERLKTKIKLAQKVRWEGEARQVTISRAPDGRYYASVLVDATNYNGQEAKGGAIGVDLGVTSLAVLSNGEVIPANQKLKASLKKLKKNQRRLSRKQNGSNRRAKAKLKVARIHQRVSRQRRAVLHELTNRLTREYEVICIEDLNVAGMVRNHCLARAVSDAGFGMFRSMLEQKAFLRGGVVKVVDRWFPSSKTCSACGAVKDKMPLGIRTFHCDCGFSADRDLNAAINILKAGEDTLGPTVKRAEERCKTIRGSRVDDANETTI